MNQGMSTGQCQRGFNLMEVVIAIFVFVVGLLSLAALQGALTRSTADAKLRTDAATIAESLMEAQRGFTTLVDDGGGGFDYSDIITLVTPLTVTAADGMVYTVNQTVTDYYYSLVANDFTTTAPGGVIVPDFKDVAITVSWAATDFRGTETLDAADRDLGSGSITVQTSIPSVVPSESFLPAGTDPDSDFVQISMGYTPGGPGIVPLNLGDGRYKETLVPIANVDADGGLQETSLDVLTYNQIGSNFFLERREEFVIVPCKCTLRAATPSNEGRRPVVWAGDEYTGGHFVEKPYGEPTKDRQSGLCNACCRDHHDGGSSSDDHSSDAAYNRYSPFKNATEHVGGNFANDHLHYTADGLVAGTGADYLEACRMVRVNGFFRVAQDFRREDQYVFPEDFLDDASEVNTYSSYVTTAAGAYYGAASTDYSVTSPVPCIGGVGCEHLPTMQGSYPTSLGAGELPSWTTLPLGVEGSQQLSSRGIFIDYLSEDMQTYLQESPSGCLSAGDIVDNCCVVDGSVTTTCDDDSFKLDQTGATQLLAIIPFFEAQQTAFDRWNEEPPDTPVQTSNEEILDENKHSRGDAFNRAIGSSQVMARNHRGNLGFTNTQRIDPQFTANETQAVLAVESTDAGIADGSVAALSTDPVVAGFISHELPGNPEFNITAKGDAYCERTPGGYECTVTSSLGNPTVTISGYGVVAPPDICDPDTLICVADNSDNRYACSSTLVKQGQVAVGSGNGSWAEFTLKNVLSGTAYDIQVVAGTSDPCP